MNMQTRQPDLSALYRAIPGTFDEFLEIHGSIRPNYRLLMESLQGIGADELLVRRQEIERLLQENGVTYNIYGDPHGAGRIWNLDLLPFPVDSESWIQMERGLGQRAELLDLLMKDIYGKRSIILEKVIPPEIIFSASGFLRAVHDMIADGIPAIHFFATDISRASDGSFRILSDRIQSPSGSGYALENRIILSRIFPSIFRDLQVHRLAMFFRSLRRNLFRQIRNRNREPLIVLLTPGPGNETYFEHSFLANYLGYTLAQGEDLIVRDRTLYLNTVEGYQPVDLLFRRVDDIFLDPVELKGDSLLGVAGLLDCIRAGNARIANPPGSGILENRALHPFMQKLCRFFLGEDLILPMAESYWLGEENAINHVFANPGKFVIKPVQRSFDQRSHYLNNFSEVEHAKIKKEIERQPGNYVAQEVLAGASSPVFNGEKLIAGRTILRLFTTASDSGYQVMPGGLARVITDPHQMIVMNQMGAIGKDIWILGSEPGQDIHISESTQKLSRKGASIPGRVADNLFWLARYNERCESQLRFLRFLLADVYLDEDLSDLDRSFFAQIYSKIYMSNFPDLQNFMTWLIKEIQNRESGVQFNIEKMARTSRSVQDRLSADFLKSIANLNRNQKPISYTDINDELFRLKTLFSSLSAHFTEDMSRESGWYFLNLGRRIERSIFISTLVKLYLPGTSPGNANKLEKLLKLAEIGITFRRRYRYPDLESVLDIILFDETNPRSLAFQISDIMNQIKQLPGVKQGQVTEEEKLALQLYTKHKITDISTLFADQKSSENTMFWLNDQIHLLYGLSDSITEHYFRQAEIPVAVGI